MIYAKVDVTLAQHHRVLRVPRELRAAALGAWLVALLYTRGHELDGFVPNEAIDQIASKRVIEQLLHVGLLSAHEHDGVHGFLVFRYADHNETKAMIQQRRNETRKRVDESRKRRRNADCNAVTNADVANTEVVLVPGSGSGSVVSSRRGGSGGEIRAADPLTDDLREAARIHGVKDIDRVWLKFTGHWDGRVVASVNGSWQKWCVQEVQNQLRRPAAEQDASDRPAMRSIPRIPVPQREVGDG